jgi:hypothetical protein
MSNSVLDPMRKDKVLCGVWDKVSNINQVYTRTNENDTKNDIKNIKCTAREGSANRRLSETG